VGLSILDAGVVIAVVDSTDPHHAAAQLSLEAARDRGDDLLVPASAYAEALVAPSRSGGDAVATLDSFLDALPALVAPATREVAAMAAALRAQHGSKLRLPDALVVATGIVSRADRVITTDGRWPTLRIEVEIVGPSSARAR
jgi:predicted nucleic acid-binding protein